MLALPTQWLPNRPTLPKVLIAAHERSGAQFLLDSLAWNFGYNQADDSNTYSTLVDDPRQSICDASLAHLPGLWASGLLKSHYEFGFYDEWLRRNGDELQIIYVVRDALPVMRSYHRRLWQIDHFEGPCVVEGSQFIRTAPAGAMLRFQYQRAETMVHRWANHVRGWLEGANKHRRRSFMILRFDSLNEDFDLAVKSLATFLRLPAPSIAKRPPKLATIQERSDLPATIEFRLTDSDLEFIHSVTNAVHELIADCRRAIPST